VLVCNTDTSAHYTAPPRMRERQPLPEAQSGLAAQPQQKVGTSLRRIVTALGSA